MVLPHTQGLLQPGDQEAVSCIDIAQSPGAGQGPAAATACSLPSASGEEADRGAQGWTQAPRDEA